LRRQLTDETRWRRDEGDVIGGSGRAALREMAEIIASATSDLLILFDGLDEMTDPLPVLQLLDLLRPETRAKIVVSSRKNPTVNRRLFRSVFEMSKLTSQDIIDFIYKSDTKLDPAVIDSIIKAAEGSPLILRMILEQIREHGVLPADVLTRPQGDRIKRSVEIELENFEPTRRETYLKALTSLAILNRPVHRSQYPARVLLEDNPFPLFVLSDDLGVAISHPAVANAILSLAALTSDSAGRHLSSLEFGAEEAERDSLLSNEFITLPVFTDVLAGKKSIVIGDRGTGKSAMFSHLSTLSAPESATVKPIVRPLTHPADLLRRLEANGSQLSTADQFRAG
jgi:hypothetical protein